MKRRVHSKSGLFLIELMISILFFSITAAVFVQVFVKSDQIRKESESLFEAQVKVSNIAEIIKCDEKKLQTSEFYYDQDWNECQKEEAMYRIIVRWQDKEELRSYTLRALDKNEKEIYQLQWKQWMGEKS